MGLQDDEQRGSAPSPLHKSLKRTSPKARQPAGGDDSGGRKYEILASTKPIHRDIAHALVGGAACGRQDENCNASARTFAHCSVWVAMFGVALEASRKTSTSPLRNFPSTLIAPLSHVSLLLFAFTSRRSTLGTTATNDVVLSRAETGLQPTTQSGGMRPSPCVCIKLASLLSGSSPGRAR